MIDESRDLSLERGDPSGPLRGRGRPRGRHAGAEQLVLHPCSFLPASRRRGDRTDPREASRFDKRPDWLRRDRPIWTRHAPIQPVVHSICCSSVKREASATTMVPVLAAEGRACRAAGRRGPRARTTRASSRRHVRGAVAGMTSSAGRWPWVRSDIIRFVSAGDEKVGRTHGDHGTPVCTRGSSVGIDWYVTPGCQSCRKASVTSRSAPH